MLDIASLVILFTLPSLVAVAFVLIRRHRLAHPTQFFLLGLIALNCLHFEFPSLLGRLGVSFHPLFPTPSPVSQDAWAMVVFLALGCLYAVLLASLSLVPAFRIGEREG